MEFFDSDRPRSWIPYELLKFTKKIAQNITKNIAILILLNRAQSYELRCCVNQIETYRIFRQNSSNKHRSSLYIPLGQTQNLL